MFRCLICGRRHYRGSVPALWCHSITNPDYVAHLVWRHRQGFHGGGTGGHDDCPICRGSKPEQLQLSLQLSVKEEVLTYDSDDICGCQG